MTHVTMFMKLGIGIGGIWLIATLLAGLVSRVDFWPMAIGGVVGAAIVFALGWVLQWMFTGK